MVEGQQKIRKRKEKGERSLYRDPTGFLPSVCVCMYVRDRERERET